MIIEIKNISYKVIMYEQEALIVNKSGLHARPAAEFVRAASLFRSDISVIFKGLTLNGKSIINILSGGISKGSCVVIRAEGPDEIVAVETLIAIIENGISEADI